MGKLGFTSIYLIIQHRDSQDLMLEEEKDMLLSTPQGQDYRAVIKGNRALLDSLTEPHIIY